MKSSFWKIVFVRGDARPLRNRTTARHTEGLTDARRSGHFAAQETRRKPENLKKKAIRIVEWIYPRRNY